MATISIYYHRPGKGLTIYEEDLEYEDERGVHTSKVLPDDISLHLSAALQKQGMLQHGQRIGSISKVYFFGEPFNILEFRAPDGELLGYYSDIGEPAIKMRAGEYKMIDLFLDVWLFPDRRLLELDWDEFEQALADGVINTEQANLARSAMERIKNEAARGVYPASYLRNQR